MIKKLFFFILLCFFIWLFIELFSFVFLFSSYKYFQYSTGRDFSSHIAEIKNPFVHPLFFGTQYIEESLPDTVFDPYITTKLKPNTGGNKSLEVDENGFIHNGHKYELFNKDLKRIILLGGSSVAGIKISNECTISAFLERLINNKVGYKKFEIINAGIGGSYSPKQFVRFGIELIHLNPDMVISLDGFNDFWHAFPSSDDSADIEGIAIPNRTNYQMKITGYIGALTFENFRSKFPFLTRIFWNSSILTIQIVNRINFKDWNLSTKQKKTLIYSHNTWPNLSIQIMKNNYNNYSHSDFFISNWKNLHGIAEQHNIKSIFFLQPVLPVTKKTLSQSEQENYKNFFDARSHINKNYYEESVKIFYEEVINKLDLSNDNNISTYDKFLTFVNLSQYFSEVKETVFFDNVHYNEYGNQLLANEIYRHIAKYYKLDISNKILIDNACYD